VRPAVDINTIKFDEKGLVPAIAQDYATGEVLMMAYMNREAFINRQGALFQSFKEYIVVERRDL